MTTPLVSVVVSVFNGERFLERSIRSVLEQRDVDLEIVAVDDGSGDSSGEILDRLESRDSRLRVIHQSNEGLTKALIRGCAEARGTFIARHDADDYSLKGRFGRQVALFTRYPDLALGSCWAYVIGPADEILGEKRRPDALSQPVTMRDPWAYGPLGHGSTMFRRSDYEAAGGYRPEFFYAQDIDLWLRLCEKGRIAFVPAFLYAFRYSVGSISLNATAAQDLLCRLASDAATARKAGASEEPILEAAAAVRRGANPPGRRSLGESYFIGKCLLDRRDRKAVVYLRQAVAERPANVKGWVALALSQLLCRNLGAAGLIPSGEVPVSR
jgi:glycosyltransferase involved in cell wall biosynthesis